MSSGQPIITSNALPPDVSWAAAYMLRNRTERTAANFASGEPALSPTSDDSDLTFLFSPSSWMNLYNHIQATSCPSVDAIANQITL